MLSYICFSFIQKLCLACVFIYRNNFVSTLSVFSKKKLFRIIFLRKLMSICEKSPWNHKLNSNWRRLLCSSSVANQIAESSSMDNVDVKPPKANDDDKEKEKAEKCVKIVENNELYLQKGKLRESSIECDWKLFSLNPLDAHLLSESSLRYYLLL